MAAVMKDFCANIPKIELHAHLHGSLSEQTLTRQLARKGDDAIKKDQLSVVNRHSESLDEIFLKFKLIHQILDTEDAVYEVACDVIREFSEDNVKYLELRSTPREVLSTGLTKRKYIEAVLRAMEDQEKACPDITVRYLPSIDRQHSLQNCADTISLAEEYRTRSKGRVVGLDLSGNPKCGNSKDLCGLLSEARKKGLKLTVHLGEINNCEDTLELLKTLPDRVGHGTFLHPEMGGTPEMLDIMTKHKLPLELCLSSNVKGGTVTNFDQHHFQYWFQHNHPLTVATDDKGVFSTSLSGELHIAAQTFDLSADQLWGISLQSVDYIFAGEEVKQYIKDKWFSDEQKAKCFSAV